jgi:hypothetical protein
VVVQSAFHDLINYRIVGGQDLEPFLTKAAAHSFQKPFDRPDDQFERRSSCVLQQKL